jgi:hypothetical protein
MESKQFSLGQRAIKNRKAADETGDGVAPHMVVTGSKRGWPRPVAGTIRVVRLGNALDIPPRGPPPSACFRLSGWLSDLAEHEGGFEAVSVEFRIYWARAVSEGGGVCVPQAVGVSLMVKASTVSPFISV